MPAGWRRGRRCRGFAGHPQARERRGAVEVGDDPAAVVVGGRRHREPVSPGIEAHRRERGGDGGKALAEALEPGGVEPHVVGALFGEAGHDRLAHLVAGQQLVDEALAVGVAEQRTVARSASDSSGRGMAGWWRAVGWNCTNSRSATAIPAQGHGDAVAGGLGWVRRHREQLAGSPVATSTWWARTSARSPDGPNATTPPQRPPSMSRSSANQCS